MRWWLCEVAAGRYRVGASCGGAVHRMLWEWVSSGSTDLVLVVLGHPGLTLLVDQQDELDRHGGWWADRGNANPPDF